MGQSDDNAGERRIGLLGLTASGELRGCQRQAVRVCRSYRPYRPVPEPSYALPQRYYLIIAVYRGLRSKKMVLTLVRTHTWRN